MFKWLKRAPKIFAPDKHWPADVFPTANGGHTYVGFMSSCGVMSPVPLSNWMLLSDETKAEWRRGAEDAGFKFNEL